MLYEFAITPDMFDKYSNDEQLFNSMIIHQLLAGISENGLLANLQNSGWLLNVEERLRSLDQKSKSKIFAIMKTLKDRKRIITYPSQLDREPQNDIEWLEIALKTCLIAKFHGLVLGPKIEYNQKKQEAYIVRSVDVLESPLWNCRNRTAVVSQNATDYKKHLAPIMKHAKSLSIIDQYLSPTDQRYFDTVKICLGLLKNNNVRVNIHCGVRDSNLSLKAASSILLDNWARNINAIVSLNMSHRITVFVWQQKQGGQRFHDRAIITDQCGIGIEGGLDTPTNRNTSTTFSLLDEVVMQTRLRHVDQANSVYKLLNKRIIF